MPDQPPAAREEPSVARCTCLGGSTHATDNPAVRLCDLCGGEVAADPDTGTGAVRPKAISDALSMTGENWVEIGVREERRRVIAWLESRAYELRRHPGGEVEATMAEDFAAAIKRGEHRPAPESGGGDA